MKIQDSIQVHSVKQEQLGDLERLLKSADLPHADLEQHIGDFLVIENGKELVGCAGLEVYGDVALLRSVAVQEKFRNRRFGKLLVEEVLRHGQARGVKIFYLLTNTAERFFSAFGFQVIDRSAAPEVIRSTTEFSLLCPETAVLMRKLLTTEHTETTEVSSNF